MRAPRQSSGRLACADLGRHGAGSQINEPRVHLRPAPCRWPRCRCRSWMRPRRAWRTRRPWRRSPPAGPADAPPPPRPPSCRPPRCARGTAQTWTGHARGTLPRAPPRWQRAARDGRGEPGAAGAASGRQHTGSSEGLAARTGALGGSNSAGSGGRLPARWRCECRRE